MTFAVLCFSRNLSFLLNFSIDWHKVTHNILIFRICIDALKIPDTGNFCLFFFFFLISLIRGFSFSFIFFKYAVFSLISFHFLCCFRAFHLLFYRGEESVYCAVVGQSVLSRSMISGWFVVLLKALIALIFSLLGLFLREGYENNQI